MKPRARAGGGRRAWRGGRARAAAYRARREATRIEMAGEPKIIGDAANLSSPLRLAHRQTPPATSSPAMALINRSDQKPWRKGHDKPTGNR